MENSTKHNDEVQPVVSKELDGPMERLSIERPTHLSLPKLVINPHKGPKPIEVPTPHVANFMKAMAENAPESAAFLPPPMSLNSPTHICHNKSNDEHPDPYLENPPTPDTIQFIEAEAKELQQWREIVGDMRQAHAEALDKMWDNPKDPAIRAEVRRLRIKRQEYADGIAMIHRRREIRKRFRNDFNDIVPGW